MKSKMIGFVFALSLLTAGSTIAQQNNQAEIDLQAAIRTETVTGDLKAAESAVVISARIVLTWVSVSPVNCPAATSA